MNIIPLDDRIIVRSLNEADCQGRANVGAVSSFQSAQGVVIAAGAGIRDGDRPPVPLSIKAGDMILFDHGVADDVAFGGGMYLIMKAKDARTVRSISTLTTTRREAPVMHPEGADERGVHSPLFGPHQIVIWGS
jgi:chaperonin GroES